MNIKSRLVSLLLLSVASSNFLEARVRTEAPPLIKPAESTIPPQDPDDSSVLRQQAVVVNIRLARDPKTTRLRLPLFGSSALNLVRRSRKVSHKDSVIWLGRVEGQEASAVILAVGKDVLIGNVMTQPTIDKSADYYEIGYLGHGLHVLRQFDPSALASGSDPIAPQREQTRMDGPRSADIPIIAASHRNPDERAFPLRGKGDRENAHGAVAVVSKAAFRQDETIPCTSDPASTIDVLVVYTKKAEDKMNGQQAMELAIIKYIEEANDSYARSGIAQQLRLVPTELVDNYEESGHPETDRDELKRPDGELKKVHDRRNTLGADIVGLIVEYTKRETDDTSCGAAFLMEDPSNDFEKSAFAAIPRRCADKTMGLAHEFGHLMGARHDWVNDRGEDNPEKPYPYSHGYVHVVKPKPHFRTVMAKNDRCNKHRCDLVPHWSNPNIRYPDPVSGVPTGCPAPEWPCEDDKEPSNNAKTLNDTAPIVANFRCSKN